MPTAAVPDYVMPDPVSASCNRHQRPSADPEIHLPRTQSRSEELPPADNPLLSPGQIQNQSGCIMRREG
jgi:hypothetical protein